MVRYIGPATPTGLVRQAVPEAVIGAGQVQAWVAGPGWTLTGTEAGRAQRQAVVDVPMRRSPSCRRRCPLDLVDDSVALRRAGRTTVLTPHAGECAPSPASPHQKSPIVRFLQTRSLRRGAWRS